MENNETKDNQNLVEQKVDIEVMQTDTSLNKTQSSNQNLTNEQKLEYLSRLIQSADKKLEKIGIIKKLVK